jgi:hypothetical protein
MNLQMRRKTRQSNFNRTYNSDCEHFCNCSKPNFFRLDYWQLLFILGQNLFKKRELLALWYRPNEVSSAFLKLRYWNQRTSQIHLEHDCRRVHSCRDYLGHWYNFPCKTRCSTGCSNNKYFSFKVPGTTQKMSRFSTKKKMEKRLSCKPKNHHLKQQNNEENNTYLHLNDFINVNLLRNEFSSFMTIQKITFKFVRWKQLLI